MSTLCRLALIPQRQLCRHFSVTVNLAKEIKHTETDKKITVEGVLPTTSPASVPVSVKSCCGDHQCHPFCKSPLASQVKHTDVLILDQFVDSKGQMYSMEDLKICKVTLM